MKCLMAGLMLVSGAVMGADFSISETAGEHLDVVYKGRTVMRVMTARDDSSEARTHETYKVYAHVLDPLDTDNKGVLTKGAGGKFTHHRGIYIGWSRITCGDFKGDWWHMKGEERQAFTKITSQKAGDDRLAFTIGVEWRHGKTVVLSEERAFVVHKPESNGALLIEKTSTITAVAGDAKLAGDPEHAGCQFRPSDAVSKNTSAKYMTPGKVDVKKVKDLPWVAETFKIDDRDYLVQHMCGAGLPKGTVYSAYRNYGRFGAFSVDQIAKGESKSYRYGFYVSPGGFPEDESSLNARHASFLK